MQNPIVLALAAAIRARPSAPLLTWYGAAGQRTELSVRSFANWVDKTANLLFSLDASGALVVGEVNREHPGHWMSLLLPLAAWQSGAGYTLLPDPAAAVTVIGPEQPGVRPGGVTLACSLHPFGLPLTGLPSGVTDFSTEALAQSDFHSVLDVDATATAWRDDTGARSHQDLMAAEQAGRVLVRPESAWQALAAAVIGPLIGGGSAVVVEGPMDAAALERLAAAERITTTMA